MYLGLNGRPGNKIEDREDKRNEKNNNCRISKM